MRRITLVLVAGLALILAGSAIYALNCNVSFSSVLRMDASGYCQANDWVIDNQTDFCSFWNQANVIRLPPPPCPEIDFSTYVVIVTAMGTRPNGCYGTEIYCIEEDQKGNYTVYVKDYYPRKGWFCTQMIVCPLHAVKAPIPRGTVTFQHEIGQ
ncbi:MAG: hypothetical protein GTO24_06750 [candidate division Zixibacteria bacterium]|nr:hypothetical protein [candidate division Zixibacteria bacterium]